MISDCFGCSNDCRAIMRQNMTKHFLYILPWARFRRRTFHGPTQIIKTGWIDSDTDLNSSRTKFRRRKMLFSVKLLTKYVIRIYALGSVHKEFGVWIKGGPKSIQSRIPGRARRKDPERTAEPFQTGVPNWFRHRTFHVLKCIRFRLWKVRRQNRALLK